MLRFTKNKKTLISTGTYVVVAQRRPSPLDNLLEKIEKINPNCEYYEVNYPMRTKNRQIEIDGLNKAKAILQGCTHPR